MHLVISGERAEGVNIESGSHNNDKTSRSKDLKLTVRTLFPEVEGEWPL